MRSCKQGGSAEIIDKLDVGTGCTLGLSETVDTLHVPRVARRIIILGKR